MIPFHVLLAEGKVYEECYITLAGQEYRYLNHFSGSNRLQFFRNKTTLKNFRKPKRTAV